MADLFLDEGFLRSLARVAQDRTALCLMYLFLHRATRCLGKQGEACARMCRAIYKTLPRDCQTEMDRATEIDADCDLCSAARCLHAQSVYLLGHMTENGHASQCGALYQLANALCCEHSPFLQGPDVECDRRCFADSIEPAFVHALHGCGDSSACLAEVVQKMEALCRHGTALGSPAPMPEPEPCRDDGDCDCPSRGESLDCITVVV